MTLHKLPHEKQWMVDIRQKLPDVIQSQLLNIERDQWPSHPRYGGKAAFFIQYHGDLLATAATIDEQLQALLDSSLQAFSAAQLHAVLSASRYLLERAHHHHQIEDHVYFPQFKRIMPKLSHGIDLLDQDHKILNTALHELEIIVHTMIKIDIIANPQLQDFSAKVIRLQKILQRHLYDEEELIIPIFLLGA